MSLYPFADGPLPVWAVERDEDQFGVFAGFSAGGVVQRLRWVPGGSFVMGSPEGEAGRYDDEGPPHEVTLTEGYWLGETPVTQALWKVVMGENPSWLVSDDRPVERVRWDDCRAFIQALNAQAPGLDVRLPTEAEWERACRAGTTGATWVGDLEILDESNAPLLDEIAWYRGNSGVSFELWNGDDSTGLPNKQHPHTRAGSHPVKGKRANPLGLYDMLGNVYEWCSDWHGPYESHAAINPRGPSAGSFRVFRGGSWLCGARLIRAAYRDWYLPTYRSNDVGFRLASNGCFDDA